MKHLFYEDFKDKRLNKILNVFGKSWFFHKRVLELAAGDGNIGIELLKLGADVTFSDVREQHLNTINQKLIDLNYQPSLVLINNDVWEHKFDGRFSLVLHLGLLYNLKKWREDLENTMGHTNTMILETIVNPSLSGETDKQYSTLPPGYPYGNVEDGNITPFTQEEVEAELTSLGCKFFRFDDADINSKGWLCKGESLENVYDWDYDKYRMGLYNTTSFTHFRRMWLVLK